MKSYNRVMQGNLGSSKPISGYIPGLRTAIWDYLG